MKRQVSLEEISDGRLYELNDMVKADCGDCRGCSACCRGMGNSIILDPLDFWRLSRNLGKNFGELTAGPVELNVVDGLILPNLKMAGASEACSFLDENGRCTVHSFRPGICRLFPLGRYYENGSFRYFLQVHECRKENRTKVKVKKWMDMPDGKAYEAFVNEWHYLLEDLSGKAAEEDLRKEICMYVLTEFFVKPYNGAEELPAFYRQAEERMKAARERFGI
ncbi:MAG: YkgJ family cysteine cluster protein [Lachnospiraceae bacterium]|nr:YkgJ family cysteine cluster protein [Lachnospiraceae bacterium]